MKTEMVLATTRTVIAAMIVQTRQEHPTEIYSDAWTVISMDSVTPTTVTPTTQHNGKTAMATISATIHSDLMEIVVQSNTETAP